MADVPSKQLLASVKDLLSSGSYSDLVVTCGSDVYNVHKNIVCSRCKFFSNAVSFGGKESANGKIDLPEDEPATVKLLVQYLYEAEYEPVLPIMATSTTINSHAHKFPHTCANQGLHCGQSQLCPPHRCGTNCFYGCVGFECRQCSPVVNGTAEQLVIHAKMYEIADKYEVVGLKDLAKEKFSRACLKFWNNANFPVAADYAFSTTPEEDKGLRDVVCKTFSEHMSIVNRPEVEAVMKGSNGLAFSLLKLKSKQQGWF